MSDLTSRTLPPPAPPLPPIQPRASVLHRLAVGIGVAGPRQSSTGIHLRAAGGPQSTPTRNSYAPLPSQTAAHKTGIPIAALDISPDKQHAVLAGKEILKTVTISDRKVTEVFNLRSAISSFASAHSSEARWAKRRDFLPASDVKWSHGQFDSIIATAANHGRIALYDVNRAEVEYAWIHEHIRSVHKLAFDTTKGYLLLSGSQDGTARVWDLRHLSGERTALTMKSSWLFDGRADAIRDVRWCPNDAVTFAMCTDSGTIQEWDLRYLKGPKLKLNGHGRPCVSLDYHPDGTHIASGSFDKYVRVWDTRKDRRQKPSFELRTPQAITNVRWRPSCWSSELQGTGQWQSTQLATTYTQDDPRCHIWDLRRPFIPFRELDRYNSPATDLLWCTKDLLWTVGNEGMFTQNDVTFATQTHHELTPCAISWFPDGEYTVFAEDKVPRRASNTEDPAVGFLNVPQDKLSSGELAAVSPNEVSDDDLDNDSIFTASFRRRQSRAASSKSGRSRATSPSSKEDCPTVLPLDQAVNQEHTRYDNRQNGFTSSMPGATMDPAIVKHLAGSYASAMTGLQRKVEPGKILERLMTSFQINADASDQAAMYRVGQSWRILGAVIVPELMEWADRNRKARLNRNNGNMAVPDRSTSAINAPTNGNTDDFTDRFESISNAGGITDQSGASSQKDDGPTRYHVHNDNGTSKIPTPLAKPARVTSSFVNGGEPSYDDDTIEIMHPLPDSVISAHHTATAASRALRDRANTRFTTPPSSPESSRHSDSPQRSHRRTGTQDSGTSSNSFLEPPHTASRAMQPSSPHTGLRHRSPLAARAEEDRRATNRDFKPSTRPVLNYEEPRTEQFLQSPNQGWRHDSSESLQMFSTSTDSSQNDKPLGNSIHTPNIDTPETGEYWQYGAESFESSSPPPIETGPLHSQNRVDNHRAENSSELGTTGLGLKPGLRGGGQNVSTIPIRLREPPLRSLDAHSHHSRQRSISRSPSPDAPFVFEQQELSLGKEHVPWGVKSHKPTTAATLPKKPTLTNKAVPEKTPDEPLHDLASPNYIPADFRPIDLATYAPKTPLALSALPLIAHTIAFDLESGQGCGLFAAHLLMHVHPFFYHKGDCSSCQDLDSEKPHTTLAERLMHPIFCHRVIKSILIEHLTYLKRMQLFVSMAELRNLIVEFGYQLPGADQATQESIQKDPSQIPIVCARCGVPMQDGSARCRRCRRVREPCPVCLSLTFPVTTVTTGEAQTGSNIWASCQACGHSAHVGCMEAWLANDFSKGECPTGGCECDCGPGAVRVARIERQMKAEADLKPVKGNESVKKEKADRVGESRAVDRTRRMLRDDEKGTQSADEGSAGAKWKSRDSRGGVFGARDRESRGSIGAFGQRDRLSERKVVRVMTPGEESGTRGSGV